MCSYLPAAFFSSDRLFAFGLLRTDALRMWWAFNSFAFCTLCYFSSHLPVEKQSIYNERVIFIWWETFFAIIFPLLTLSWIQKDSLNIKKMRIFKLFKNGNSIMNLWNHLSNTPWAQIKVPNSLCESCMKFHNWKKKHFHFFRKKDFLFLSSCLPLLSAFTKRQSSFIPVTLCNVKLRLDMWKRNRWEGRERWSAASCGSKSLIPVPQCWFDLK